MEVAQDRPATNATINAQQQQQYDQNNQRKYRPSNRSSSKDNDDGDNDNGDDVPKSIDEALKLLLKQHLPENQKSLKESQINLEKIANYCDENYFDQSCSEGAFKLTRNYAQQALASVASQIYSYACNLQATMSLLESQFDRLDGKKRHLEMLLKLNNEKAHRREIGLLTKPKSLLAQPAVIYPSDRSKMKSMSNKYFPEPIDYSSLDNIGIGYKVSQQHYDKSNTFDNRANMPPTKSATLRPSKSSNLSSIMIAAPGANHPSSTGLHAEHGPSSTTTGQAQTLTAAGAAAPGNIYGRTGPTGANVRPGTPPTLGNAMFGSLARNCKMSDYRTLHHAAPLLVPPPQVPSNYAASTNITTEPKRRLGPNQANMDNDDGQRRQPMVMANTITQPSTTTATTSGSSTGNTTNIDSGQQHSPQSSTDWIPSNYIEKVIAMYDYTADKDDELSFKENAIIYVIRKNDDGWWEGVLNGITGLFPGNYVELYL